MRVLNIYTYKGPTTSLVGPWITCSYFTEDIYQDVEVSIPSVKHMFDRRDDISKFGDLLKDNFDVNTIYAHEINHQGAYCCRESQDYMIRRARWRGRKFDVNIISKPKAWYERLTVIAAVFYRYEYLKRMSRPNYNLLELDTDLNLHINTLISYKHLPPMYLWDKTMEAIKNVEPKPLWWFSEINYLRRELEYDEPC